MLIADPIAPAAAQALEVPAVIAGSVKTCFDSAPRSRRPTKCTSGRQGDRSQKSPPTCTEPYGSVRGIDPLSRVSPATR